MQFSGNSGKLLLLLIPLLANLVSKLLPLLSTVDGLLMASIPFSITALSLLPAAI